MEIRKVVKITNYKQAGFYISQGVKPIDVIYTNKIVFIFNEESTKDVWNTWRTCRVEM